MYKIYPISKQIVSLVYPDEQILHTTCWVYLPNLHNMYQLNNAPSCSIPP